MPQIEDNMVNTASPQNCVARALYDNIAESPDELAFRKGDLLTVLEQNTGGIEGWWLCSLRGRQGICPGNRLRLIAGVYEGGQGCDLDVSILQRQGKRRSWHVQPNKVLTPQKFGDVYLYDMPPNRNNSQARYDVPPTTHITVVDGSSGRTSRPSSGDSLGGDCYDTPRTPRACYDTPTARVGDCYDTPTTRVGDCYDTPTTRVGDCYDVPRPLAVLTPSSSLSSLTTDSLSGSNRSSLAPEYDVPRSRPSYTAPHSQQLYDVPPTNPVPRELPLELGSALESLARLETEATSAISRLLGYAGPQWREKERLEPRLMDIKLAVLRLRTSLHDLAEFGEGALGNAAKAADKSLCGKLQPLVKALRTGDKLVQETCNSLESMNWSVDQLCRVDSDGNQLPDALDQLVATAKALTEDVKQTASFIQGNSTLLFKRGATSPNRGEWLDDYDYVNLESKDSVAKQHAEISESLPPELSKSYDALVREAEAVAISNSHPKADDSDRQVLVFYMAQCSTHTSHLTHAIDAFLQTVEHNQPPKVFLAHGKFVVLSAHRLVHIGDSVHRNVSRTDVRNKVLQCANQLSEALATTVHKTKMAALQFPSVTAVQEMIDSVVDISHLARDLKMTLVAAVQQQM
ncbi:breast cancer anti-estrogen resistance protein 1 [Nilaparvata lugens]|uniref:breast cancer anti-estrogen resistance protein 1 n=1 Tax=Nilaparvata lugens TaxID=108931 RepID=UPI000B999D36|nr:breast cancer anti-estrogen resistance protein 1 [Nilaparvata lugens]